MKSPTITFNNPQLLHRAAYVAVIAVCIAATLLLVSARDRAVARAHDVATRQAWQSNTSAPSAPVTPEAVFSRFNMKTTASNAASADLSWQAGTTTELRASLRALDTALVRLGQVKITRSATGFVVSAERTP